jgi:hypothetical protein
VSNTVVLARTYNAAAGQVGTVESTAVNAMAPTHLRVPVGTTVTFVNPADNLNAHSATQFFEGLFNFNLQPGPVRAVHLHPEGRVLLQRLLQPQTDRQGRGVLIQCAAL